MTILIKAMKSADQFTWTKPDDQEIISRTEARERGLKFFYTGKRCIHGHDALRYTSNGKCAECAYHANDEQQREYRKKNPERIRRLQREYYARYVSTKEGREKHNAKARNYRKKNREHNREYMKKYMREYRKRQQCES